MNANLKQFVFKGLLGKHAIQDMQATGVLHRPEVTQADRQQGDLFVSVQESIRGASLQMQSAYRLLFILENIVRDLISTRFAEPDGPDWFDDRATTQMKAKVEQRKQQEEKNQWHAGRNKESIFYLDFGDLSRLITSNWTIFEDLLPNQSWVQSRLDEAERSRNVIAHTNILSSDEVARLEMYLRDWIKQIG
ncbi:MAG: Swt1 family HEPN domain-containing protein [Acidobacteriota bacterium]|nr:Swt1 family HEPN domain-containing protein [Acidobacteriota bacterium]